MRANMKQQHTTGRYLLGSMTRQTVGLSWIYVEKSIALTIRWDYLLVISHSDGKSPCAKNDKTSKYVSYGLWLSVP